MRNLTTTADVRDLDCVPLGRVGGADYYEVHSIVRDQGGKREIIGRASEWPTIQARAKAAHFEQVLMQSENHVAQLIQERDALRDEVAMLRAAVLTPAAPEQPGCCSKCGAALGDDDPHPTLCPSCAPEQPAKQPATAPIVLPPPNERISACLPGLR